MVRTADSLKAHLDALGAVEPAFAAAIERAGYPEPRTGVGGYPTLLRAIIGQQVSVAAAAAIWNKLDAAVGGADDPARMAAASEEVLRGAGLSRQKASYAHALAEAVATGALDFAALAEEDDAAVAELTAIKGIGRWTAEIYLLFAEGRPDVWPAGDLAVQIEVGRILGHEAKPSEKQLRAVAEPWRPYRSAAAVFAWHHRRIVPL